MKQVAKEFGLVTQRAWMMGQLRDLSEATSKKQLSERQQELTADMIIAEYGYLKLSEIMLFLYEFKCGRYGTFYGAVDPQLIMCKLQEFIILDRNIILEDEERRRRDEESKTRAVLPREELMKRIESGEFKNLRNFIKTK